MTVTKEASLGGNMEYLISPIFYIVLTTGLLVLLSKKNGLLWCTLAYVAYNVVMFAYFGDITGLGVWWINALAFLAYTPLSFAPFLFHAVFKKYDSFLFTLIFPITYFVSEFATTYIRMTPGLNPAYYFFYATPLIQCVSIVGAAGLSFTLAWFIESLVTMVMRRFKPKYVAAVVCSGLLLGTLLIWGVCRLNTADEPTEYIHAAWTTGPEVAVKDGEWVAKPYEECRDSFVMTSAEAGKTGAELLIYSEETITADKEQREEMLNLASDTAREYNMAILLGFDAETESEDKHLNCIYYIDREGNVSNEYVKRMVIPIVEDLYKRGNGEVLQVSDDFDCRMVKMAATICYDGNFEMYSRKMDDDSDVYLYPSWDWKDIENMHTMIAGFRAVENGVTLAKSTVNGRSVLYDSYGRILFESNTEDGFEKVYCFELPCCNKVTFYEKYGDYFNILAAALAVVIYGIAACNILRQRKASLKSKEQI